MRLDAQIRWLDSVDSTNAEALRAAASGLRGPIWFAAHEQREGRGRRSRNWSSSSDDLTASLLLEPLLYRPSAAPAEVATLSFVVGLALADAVAGLGAAAPPRLKWPNDLLMGGGKLAGILLESRPPALAIGVGVNIAAAAAQAAVIIEAHASRPVALADFVDPADVIDKKRVLDALAEAFADRFETWRAEGFAGLRADWLARAERFRGTVIARLPKETLQGRFVDLDAEGALILETPSGRRAIHAADVYWPPAG